VVDLVTDKPRLLTRAELAEGRRLLAQMFDGPWRYKQFMIECGVCEGNINALPECTNPECEGAGGGVPATFVEAPEMYPASERHPQIVATIEVPGIGELAQGNGEAICWLRNNSPSLLAAHEQLQQMRAAINWLCMNPKTGGVLISDAAKDPVAEVIAYAKSLGWDPDV
jgi:hypothetical protein